MVFIRKLARIEQVRNAESLGVPKIDSNPDDADWTTEVQAVTEDTGLAFGRATSPRIS